MIGFVNVCHEDYVDKNAVNMATLAIEGLKKKGIEVFAVNEPVTNYKNAEEAGKTLARHGVDGVILFLGTWIECPNAMSVLREVEHLPVCLWGFGMFEAEGRLESTGSYVSFSMFKGVMDRVGYKYKPVLGGCGDEETLESVVSFCKAAHAEAVMKRARIGLVGYTSMSIYTGTFDHVLLRAKIGPEVVQMDSYTVINKAQKVKESDTDKTIDWLKQRAKIHSDVSQEHLRKAANLTFALKEICGKEGLCAMNVKCQYEFSKEYGMVACVPVSALSDMGIVGSCEGDMMNTVSMMILHLLSGNVVTYGDSMNHENNTLKLSSCGFIPFSMGQEQQITNFMPHPGFTGIQNSFVLRPERVTVMRLIEDIGDYHILYFTGQGLPTQKRQGFMPALDVVLDGDVNELVKNYAGQHFAICYGDISSEIEDYCRLKGIRAIRV